jgi:hypothetical protein
MAPCRVATWCTAFLCRPPARSPPFIQSLATANNKCRPPARESSGARRPRGHGHPREPAHAGILRLCRAGVTPVVRAVRGAVPVGAPGVPPACAGVPPTGSTRGSATRCAARPCGSSTEPIELGHKTTYCRLRGSPPCPTPARSCLSPCGQLAESSARIDDLRARRLLPARAGVLRGPSRTTSPPGCTTRRCGSPSGRTSRWGTASLVARSCGSCPLYACFVKHCIRCSSLVWESSAVDGRHLHVDAVAPALAGVLRWRR